MAQPGAEEDKEMALESEAKETDDIEDDTFEFRLFAPVVKHSAEKNDVLALEDTETAGAESKPEKDLISRQVYRIKLSSPADDGATADLRAGRTARPLEYYVAALATPTERMQYEEAAISGELVRELANRPCPGLRLPWRVISWPPAVFKANNDAVECGTVSDSRRRRARKGKKTRLKVRRKMQVAREREDNKKAEARAKEELQRLKEEKVKEKNRKVNRKKQLKKRERQRELKKAEADNLGSRPSP